MRHRGYINRLTRSGLKVAVCEQVGDPKLTKGDRKAGSRKDRLPGNKFRR